MRRTTSRLVTTIAALGLLGATTVAVSPAGAAPLRPVRPSDRHLSTPRTVTTTPTSGGTASGGTASGGTASGNTVLIVTASKAEQATLTRSVGQVHSMLALDGQDVAARFRKSLPSIGAISLQVPSAQAQSVAASLRKDAGISSVEVTSPLHFDSVTPNDTDWATKQASYLGAGGVNASAAWSIQEGSPDVKIAILDSGVTVTHPDLENKIVGQYNADNGSTDVTDTLGHGTFVAGVAAAQTNNNLGIAGAGFNSSILAVKVADSNDVIQTDDVVNGISWAVANGANVINMSFGSPTKSPAIATAIAQAEAAGVVVVASAGNSGNIGDQDQYPADDPGVISVGATDGPTKRASFSQYGAGVTVAAPGVNIYSTTNPAGSAYFPAVSYDSGDGTSFSSPIVAGEAALLKAQSPTASGPQIRAAIVDSAHGYAGQGEGHGQVDFALALEHLPPTTTPTITSPQEGSSGSGTIVLTASSTAPKVQFSVDGVALGSPVPVVDGVATSQWNSLGQTNASHTVTARDCDAYTECNVEPAVAPALTHVIVDNAAPVVTAPSGAVTGVLNPAATAPAGSGVAFYIDGKRVGFDGAAPYSILVGTSSVSNGTHAVTAHECNSTATICSGPVSAPLSFSTDALLPTLSALSPKAFSSNGHGSRTSVSGTLTIPSSGTERAYLSVATSSGADRLTDQVLGTFAPGQHTITWHGLGDNHQPVGSGSYQFIVTTTGSVDGLARQGSVITPVTVDNISPTLSSETGNGTGFYPYVDGYKDTFEPSVVLSEPSTLSLVITTSAGKAVRTVTVAEASAGRHTVTWNGHYSDGKEVPGATYHWHFSAVDTAGNAAHSATYSVSTSTKRLVAKSVNLVHNGDGVSSTDGQKNYLAFDDGFPNCVFYDDYHDALQGYKYGVTYLDQCASYDVGYQSSTGLYTFTVPSATEYSSLSLSATGKSYDDSAVIDGGYDLIPTSGSADGAQTYPNAGVSISSASTKVYGLGSVSPAFHITTSHQVYTEFDMVNANNNQYNDFDLEYLTLTVKYKVLE